MRPAPASLGAARDSERTSPLDQGSHRAAEDSRSREVDMPREREPRLPQQAPELSGDVVEHAATSSAFRRRIGPDESIKL